MSIFEPIRWTMSVPTLLRGDGRPDTVAHHVLMVLATFADPDGTNVRPSVATLTKRAHLTTQKSVTDALQRLEEAKLIIRTGQLRGGTVLWRLNFEIQGDEKDLYEERAAQRRAAAADRQRRRRELLAESKSHAVVERDVTSYQSVTDEPVSRGASANVTGCQSVSHAVPARTSRGGARDTRRSPRLHQPLDQPLTNQGDLFPPTADTPPGQSHALPGRDEPIEASNAQAIVGHWIDQCRKRPPQREIGHIAKQVKALLSEGIDPADVESGLANWHKRAVSSSEGLSPSLLPSFVNAVMNRPAAPVGRSTGSQSFRNNPPDAYDDDEGI